MADNVIGSLYHTYVNSYHLSKVDGRVKFSPKDLLTSKELYSTVNFGKTVQVYSQRHRTNAVGIVVLLKV